MTEAFSTYPLRISLISTSKLTESCFSPLHSTRWLSWVDGEMSDQTSQKVDNGHCLCGAVQYKLVGDPIYNVICHCPNCRRTSGSTFVTAAIYPKVVSAVLNAYSREVAHCLFTELHDNIWGGLDHMLWRHIDGLDDASDAKLLQDLW